MSGSRSSARPSPSEIGNLRIFKDPVGVLTVQKGRSPFLYAEVSPDDPRYEAVASIIHVALAILESRQGKARLARAGLKIIEERTFRRDPHIYNGRLEDLPLWVDSFLQEIRSDFPDVYLTNTARGEARMQRHNWGSDMRRYNAKAAGILQINKMIVDNMVAVGQRTLSYRSTTESGYENCMMNWETFVFQLGVSVAHEVVHFFTGFITGTRVPDTPPGVAYVGFGDDEIGEAGRFWEGQLFGGIVDFYEDPRDPLGQFQAGVPLLAFSTARGHFWVRIDQEYIRQFIQLRFQENSFPAQAAPQTAELDLHRRRSRYGLNMADFRANYLPRGTPSPLPDSRNRNQGPPPGTSRYLDEIRFPRRRHALLDSIRPSMLRTTVQVGPSRRGR